MKCVMVRLIHRSVEHHLLLQHLVNQQLLSFTHATMCDELLIGTPVYCLRLLPSSPGAASLMDGVQEILVVSLGFELCCYIKFLRQ